MNCFPLDEYFNSTGRNDIRFGRRKEMGNDNWDSDDQTAIFTRWQYEHRELWWDQVRRKLWPTMKDRVLRWINNKSNDVTSGDTLDSTRVKRWGYRTAFPVAFFSFESKKPAHLK